MPDFWYSLLFLFLFLLNPAQGTEIHLAAENMQTDPALHSLHLQGNVRVFAGDLRILAAQALWDSASQSLQAWTEVQVHSPDWQLRADSLSLELPKRILEAQQGELQTGPLRISFQQAWLHPDFWLLQQVHLKAEGIPGYWRAAELRIYPQQPGNNLLLSHLQWSLLPLSLPSLQAHLPLATPPPELPAEIRDQMGWFAPSLNLVEGGLAIRTSSRLYQDPQQRLYARLDYHPQWGWQGGLSHEWRQWGILNSEILGLSTPGQSLRGHLSWQGELGPGTLRSGLYWQEPSVFFNRLLLPPLQIQRQTSDWYSAHVWLGDWFQLPGLRWRPLLGLQWDPAGLTSAGSLQWQSQAWIPLPGLGLQASGLFNGLSGPGLQDLTAGLRLLGEWQVPENWILGAYAEHYASSLKADFFAQSWWLRPRAGTYAVWKVNPNLALGTRLEWVLPAQELTALESLLSLHQGIWVMNLLLQAWPPGLQIQFHSSLF